MTHRTFLFSTAIHEAGHAATIAALGGRLASVEVFADATGTCRWWGADDAPRSTRAVIAVAGFVAEQLAGFDGRLQGSDRRNVIACGHSPDDLGAVEGQAKLLLRQNWCAVLSMADMLMSKRQLRGVDVHRLFMPRALPLAAKQNYVQSRAKAVVDCV